MVVEEVDVGGLVCAHILSYLLKRESEVAQESWADRPTHVVLLSASALHV